MRRMHRQPEDVMTFLLAEMGTSGSLDGQQRRMCHAMDARARIPFSSRRIDCSFFDVNGAVLHAQWQLLRLGLLLVLLVAKWGHKFSLSGEPAMSQNYCNASSTELLSESFLFTGLHEEENMEIRVGLCCCKQLVLVIKYNIGKFDFRKGKNCRLYMNIVISSYLILGF